MYVRRMDSLIGTPACGSLVCAYFLKCMFMCLYWIGSGGCKVLIKLLVNSALCLWHVLP